MVKILNLDVYTSILKQKLREKGLNPSLIHTIEYNTNITFKQQKLINEAKIAAKKRTLEIQNQFNILDIDRTKYDREFIQNVS